MGFKSPPNELQNFYEDYSPNVNKENMFGQWPARAEIKGCLTTI